MTEYIKVFNFLTVKVHHNFLRYWSTIDDALRRVAFDKGIQVKLLTSKWSHTSGQQTAFIESLNEFGKMPYINGSIVVVSVVIHLLNTFFALIFVLVIITV